MSDQSEVIKQYLTEIGRKGGKAKSSRKTESSRENGKKGGRPRKANPDTKESDK
jgi:general stress protein YciG